jgi:hypothetical protein
MPTAKRQPGRDHVFLLTVKQNGSPLLISEPNNLQLTAFINNERVVATWLRTANDAMPGALPLEIVDDAAGKIRVKLPAEKTESSDCENVTVFIEITAQYDDAGEVISIGNKDGDRIELVHLTSASNRKIQKLY